MQLLPKTWFTPRASLDAKSNYTLTLASFLLPLLLWSLVSYVPQIWHPKIEITNSGDAGYLRVGMLVDKEVFYREVEKKTSESKIPPEGVSSNPVYLPAPHEVATALYTAFTTPPKRSNEPWLHESLLHSIKIIALGFFWSVLIGVPLGILAGTYESISKLVEPFTEFFRYLPAPAFGALAVAILGIYDAPKVAIIFIGTVFQMILIVANTTRKLSPALIEAALTLGCSGLSLLKRVIIPGVLPDMYRDMRILLGWAWTYLIVAELIGTSSGITWFITQQARYKNFDNVFAAILIIGIIGVTTDLILGWLGKKFFPWHSGSK
ncbi:ABC transporter permease subunit [Thiomicrorhabdus sp. ZW0627]|uniref:ABC transporter permease n=1 Tax=Thiomicrorhabdus sp. ZW0627 TaxID=3039774 RepID=UPI0024367CE5|nr:ABC transporter permease [Thiomicrorhabdus sp. ZW0627]MDG6773681.1 ABC transporter permease subunit [Thiomicrorhabdus sp. ZW0627]